MADKELEGAQADADTVSFRRRRQVLRAAFAAAAANLPEARDKFSLLQSRDCTHRPRRRRSDLSEPQELPPPGTVTEAFESTRSLVAFANVFGLDHASAIRALAAGGIDIYQAVALEWERGCSVRALSAQHGVTRSTIGRWIKKGGRDIRPRNANQKHDEDLIVEVFRDTKSANRAAQAANVHWATARRVLRKHNLWHDT